ncbi:hypothetical protein, partial [Eubacterium callanderi]|uniref:hypothetical protein n=1 Tax=Eubacterium callanderi TaxID=53442 RepID=UPI00391C487A
MQLPSVIQRADHIVAPMDDYARQMGDLMHVANQLVGLQEGIIGEVMALDTRNGQCALRLGETLHMLRTRAQA